MSDSDDRLYFVYLNAFAVTRSGGSLVEWTSSTVELSAARALGAQDGQDHETIARAKSMLLDDIEDMMTWAYEEKPCKVVPMSDKP